MAEAHVFITGFVSWGRQNGFLTQFLPPFIRECYPNKFKRIIKVNFSAESGRGLVRELLFYLQQAGYNLNAGCNANKNKKDGPNHPFLPNLTYFYEKNLMLELFLCLYVSKILQEYVKRYKRSLRNVKILLITRLFNRES